MTIALRDYQIECLDTVLNESKAGVNRQLVSLPTGSGKTVIMSAIAKHLNKKTLVIAHREELIEQAHEKFKLFWPEIDIGICMAERNDVSNQIIVGSVQSCSRPKRLERLKEQNFDVLMIDEAHHSSADSYQTIIDSLGFGNGSRKLLLGVTATPMRSDNQGLGDTFEKLVFSRSIATMIKAGYLSPVIGRKILTSFVLKGIRTYNGDFAISELSEAVNTHERNDFIIDKFKEYSKDRKGIAFCVDVAHCKDLAASFNKNGIKAEAVWGDMDPDKRKKVLKDLKKGKIQIATSCGVLTEGFDEPSIDAVIMARPTKSPGLYIQCVGRGLRLWPGKQDCLVLDFTDRSNNLDAVMSLTNTIPEAIHVSEEDKEKPERKEEIDRRPKIHSIEDIDREFDILGSARFIWVPIGDDEFSLMDDERKEIVICPSGNGYVATLHFPDGTLRQIVSSPLPLDYCSGVCEDFARRHLKIAFADIKAPWMNNQAPPTQGQKDYLTKQGAYHEGLSKAEATIEIRKIVAMKNKQRRKLNNESPTDMQKYFLKDRGIDTKGMNKLQAMQLISKIKQTESVRYG